MSEHANTEAAPTTSDLGAAFMALQTGLLNYLRRRVNDPDLAEDLIQEVFLKASASIQGDKPPRDLTKWLYTAARTTVIDHYRSTRQGTVDLDENLPEAPVNDEQLHQELALCLRPLTQQLPAIYRDTLLATDFDGKTMQAIANEQGLSLSAIKSRASRGRTMLKDKLLACCQIETSGGLVADYQKRSPSRPCNANCD